MKAVEGTEHRPQDFHDLMQHRCMEVLLVCRPYDLFILEEAGQLTERIRRRPYSVVLFDEIEKAHPEVFNALLALLDDGRLTDGQGRTVDFRNTVVVMTSNLGSDLIQELAGEENYDAMKNAVMDVVGTHFRPEFVNRIDDLVVFHPLGRDQIREDAVGDVLVEGALVAKRPGIELQRLEFDAALVGDVFDQDLGEIRLAGLRAEAG